MKKINRIKIALDALMLLILVLLYRKNVLGLTFHEIAGLAVAGLFIIHKLLNGSWILAVTGRLFSKKTPFRQKLHWLLDFLLLLCFAYILLSGILISQVLFDGQRGSSVWKTGHYAVSALALALVGVHLGLHYEFVIKRTPARRLPLWFRRAAAVVMSVLILGFGVYQITATSFLPWISGLGAVVGADGEAPALGEGQEPGEFPADGAEPENEGGGHGNGARDGSGKGRGNGNGGGDTTAADPAGIGDLLLAFLSITLAFSVVTAWIDGVQRARKRRRLLHGQASA